MVEFWMTHDFTHIQNDNSRLETRPNTSNQTTSNNDTEGITASTSNQLDDNTNSINNAAYDDGPLATNDIGHITSDQCTEESSSRQNRDDQRRMGCGQSIHTRIDQIDEHLGPIDTVDVTGVISKEHTTQGGKAAKQVGLPSNWRLNAVDIRSCVESHVGDLAERLVLGNRVAQQISSQGQGLDIEEHRGGAEGRMIRINIRSHQGRLVLY